MQYLKFFKDSIIHDIFSFLFMVNKNRKNAKISLILLSLNFLVILILVRPIGPNSQMFDQLKDLSPYVSPCAAA